MKKYYIVSSTMDGRRLDYSGMGKDGQTQWGRKKWALEQGSLSGAYNLLSLLCLCFSIQTPFMYFVEEE